MKYFVTEIDGNKTTTTGKSYHKVSLEDESGQATKNVSIWQDFPNFQSITFQSEVVGDLVPAKDPKYGPTLYPPRSNASGGTTRASGAITKAMDRKESSIGKFQENKEESIKISSTMRDAVLLTIAQGITGLDEDVIQTKIERWREYLWHSWNDPEKYPPFPNK